MIKRGLAAVAVGMLAVPVVIVGAAAPASATTTITVSNANDNGAGSLRQALIDGSTGGTDEGLDLAISVPSSVGNITLTGGELQYDGGLGGAHSLSVTGSGQTISAANTGGFDVETTGTFTLNNMNISLSSSPGDGIFAEGPVVGDHIAVAGADEGIIVEGGGNGTLHLTDSQVTDSIRTGIETAADITLLRSTIADNQRYGIDTNDEGDAIITNSTVSGNSTDPSFDGVHAVNVVLKYATVVNNGPAASDHDVNAQGNLTSFGSVVALGGHTANCTVGGTTTSQGYNLSDDSSCGFTGTGDQQGTSNAPMLGSLGNNGGATSTRVPQAGSPLLDAIPTASCAAGISTDQRGITRPQGTGCDIGAVEVAVDTPPTTAPPGGGSTAPPAAPVNAQPSLTG
jgi:hypothetical protein